MTRGAPRRHRIECMHLFLSWSGERSRGVAEALRQWIPMVLQSVEVWMSASDIEKGAHWDGAIAEQLSNADMGVVCLTPENINRPWILFEAGALAKRVTRARVCTYLFSLQPHDLAPPLGLFQHTVATPEDTRKLLHSLNTALDKQLNADTVDALFDSTWPSVYAKLKAIPDPTDTAPASRSLDDMVAELLDISRARTSTATVDTVLSKLQHIELALFILSYRTLGRTAFERVAFSILDASQRLYKGNEQTDALVKGAWDTFRGIVEQHEQTRRDEMAKSSSLEETADKTAPKDGPVG